MRCTLAAAAATAAAATTAVAYRAARSGAETAHVTVATAMLLRAVTRPSR